MKNRIITILPIAFISIVFVVFLFFIPIEFSAISNKFSAFTWLCLTNTGGKFGSGIIIILICLLVARSFKKTSKQLGIFIVLLLMFGIALIGFAQLNEHLIKERFQVARPNLIVLSNEYNFDVQELYEQEGKAERTIFLEKHVQRNSANSIVFKGKVLDVDIWKHWLHETGYSFPSGHSVNAFLMAMLISYLLLLHYARLNKIWIILIYIWAIVIAYSRVVLGVHSATDVTLGALWGTLLGLVFISLFFVDFVYDKWLKKV